MCLQMRYLCREAVPDNSEILEISGARAESRETGNDYWKAGAEGAAGFGSRLALSELMLVDLERLDFRVQRGLWDAESGSSS